jgi:hypothetical protein
MPLPPRPLASCCSQRGHGLHYPVRIIAAPCRGHARQARCPAAARHVGLRRGDQSADQYLLAFSNQIVGSQNDEHDLLMDNGGRLMCGSVEGNH